MRSQGGVAVKSADLCYDSGDVVLIINMTMGVGEFKVRGGSLFHAWRSQRDG